MSRTQETSKYSVLILGSTQAGKSALIEHIRSYVDPGYAIDESLLGDGIASKTDTTTPFFVESNLPTYEAYRKETGEAIDLKNLSTRYKDEEDYRDALLSHPDAVGMRQVPQDLNTLSESMEFQFLDTPGLNGTQGKDSENAASIVNEVVNTQSFNLIVFVISANVPLTEDKLLALEYFAYVLRGLHSKIVFLHTHVDYYETHHSNITHNFDMKLRVLFLSNIFRRHASEAICDKDNIVEYPSLTIDLITRNRPIVQCLIRNTIRDILMLAAGPPTFFDTNAENIKRISEIPYPVEFNQEQRKKLEIKLREESQRALDARQSLLQKHSVLVLGKTQSGKSALIEYIKNYADPGYSIDRSLLGLGNLSTTKSPRSILVNSNLPTYEVFYKESGEVIDLKDFSRRVKNEDEFRYILSLRSSDVHMRLAPQDPDNSLENVEFRFMDTPGLNNTDGRDGNHFVNIISEIINTRSFNLIVIVVSFMDSVTLEQQLSLEYYAEVLRGLHSRIVFLHTHVDPNDTQSSKMIDRINFLNRVFRPFDSDTVPGQQDTRRYPHLKINLVSKKRPVINCLIRNTIRELLKMATQAPVIFDTSDQNIERIRAVTHPSKFNSKERQRIKARFAAAAAKLPKQSKGEQIDVGGEDLEQINILLIGDVQSGKSSLVETFKLYADRHYVVSTQHITQGNSRFADEKVKVTAFLSDLHTVEIRKLRQNTDGHDVIDLEEKAKTLSELDVEDLLNLGPKNAETVIIASNGAKKYHFHIYEGPGLDESAKNFEKNIFSVYRTLVESEQKFHQVLFTLAPGPITSNVRTTIRVCSDVFSDLNPLFSFVHTKMDYTKLYVGNRQFQDSLWDKQNLLQLIIESRAVSHLIDCNLQSNSPVHHAKTMNVVYNILKSAIGQMPLALKSTMMKKTPRMLHLDRSLKWQSRKALRDSKKEIIRKSEECFNLRCYIDDIHDAYKNMDQAEYDSACSNHEVVFQDMYLAEEELYPEIHVRTMTFDKQERTIEKVVLYSENVEAVQIGGEGFNYFKITYCRMGSEPAFLAVALYAKRLNSYGGPAYETEDMTAIRHYREQLVDKLDMAETGVRDLENEPKRYHLLRYCILRETLPMTVMGRLMQAGVYGAREPTTINKIRQIYLNSEVAFGVNPYEGSIFRDVDRDLENLQDVVENFSILVFGKTQAGKSSFIEFVKNYANQEYSINKGLIGNGFKSKTGKPARFAIRSNLPTYEVIESNGTWINIDALADQCKDDEEYFDALRNRETLLRPMDHDPDVPLPREVQITFLDTPGFEDTDGRDIEHAPRIIDEMAKMRTFNLIVILVNSQEPPSKPHQQAFDYYSKVIRVLQGHHNNIVFVYTHVECNKSHPSNIDHHKKMKLRHKAFSRLFRGGGVESGQQSFTCTAVQEDDKIDLYPMHTIDLGGKNLRPIEQCMRFKTLQAILQQAVTNPPVPLDTVMTNLLRVYGIDHPDELNQEQQRELQDTKLESMEQQEECSYTSEPTSDIPKTQDDNFKGVIKEERIPVQRFSSQEDYEGYLDKSDQPNCSDSEVKNDSEVENNSSPILSNGNPDTSEE
ncbi:hypothetical protein BG006_000960 [Podila minutissima]|uniref:G domain-containing protein n=1 Tax=Podila minutissima TaxID=64525 RepID=A0A9P5VHC1_9FUNG|nr:hypothetical protein BG006_000960 [Podila minutissima]